MSSTIQDRVVLRYAKEFANPEALKRYLGEHPEADPSRHSVVEKAKPAPAGEVTPPKDETKGDGETTKKAPSKSKPGLLKRLLSIKGVAAQLKKAPESVKKFLTEPETRKASLSKATAAIRKAPKAYVKSLVKTAKHEVKEFKEAGLAVAGIMKGKKPTPEQKKAIKTVAIHMAITAAAAALTTATPALAGMAMGKAIGRHIALKAAAKVMGDLHILDEVGHIGHGLTDILTKLAADKENVSPEDALAALVLKHVTQHIDALEDSDIEAAVSGGSDKEAMQQRVAGRYLSKQGSADSKELVGHLKAVKTELLKWRAWSKGFLRVFREAQLEPGLPSGYVWQAPFIEYWKPFDPIERRLMGLANTLDGMHLDEPHSELNALIQEAASYADPPRGARIEDAIRNPKFIENPELEESNIGYPVSDLLSWNRQFTTWLKSSIKGVDLLIKKTEAKP